MRYPTAAAFRRALEDRLNRRARTTGETATRLRKNVVFQRLLARLLVVSPGRWILKGGLALDFRLSDRGARPRSTKDVDLVLLATHEPFLAGELRAALEETFTARDTHPYPASCRHPRRSGPGRTPNWPSRLASPPRSRTGTSGHVLS
jgi:hypothetical protein